MISTLAIPTPPRLADRRGPYVFQSCRHGAAKPPNCSCFTLCFCPMRLLLWARLTTTTPLSNAQKVPLSVARHTTAGIEQRWVGQEQGRTEERVSEDGTKKTPSDCGWLFQSLASSRPSDPTHQPFRRDLSGGFSPVTQASLSLSERWCPSGASSPLSPMWPC